MIGADVLGTDRFVCGFLASREQDLYTATVSSTALGPVVLRNITGETFCASLPCRHLCCMLFPYRKVYLVS